MALPVGVHLSSTLTGRLVQILPLEQTVKTVCQRKWCTTVCITLHIIAPQRRDQLFSRVRKIRSWPGCLAFLDLESESPTELQAKAMTSFHISPQELAIFRLYLPLIDRTTKRMRIYTIVDASTLQKTTGDQTTRASSGGPEQ